MTLQEMDTFISNEVRGMTEGIQEPALYAHPEMLCRSLTRLAPIARRKTGGLSLDNPEAANREQPNDLAPAGCFVPRAWIR